MSLSGEEHDQEVRRGRSARVVVRVEIVEGLVQDELQEPVGTMTIASEDKVDIWE